MKREVRFEGNILTLVTLDDHWEVVEHVPAVCVLALREKPGREKPGRGPGENPGGLEVLGVSQSRPAIDQETWELPAGLIDEGETPEEAAGRELLEETGLKGTLTLVTQMFTSPGYSTEKIYLFEAKDLLELPHTPDPDEPLTVQWRSLEGVWRDVQEGRVVTSAPTLVALAHALGRPRGL